MSFSEKETSVQDGRPIELYEFRFGPGDDDAYRFTTAEQEVVYSTKVYSPLPISRGRVSSSGTFDRTSLSVSVPKSCQVVELFRVYAPAYPVVLTIREGHETDLAGEFNVIWIGRVLSCNRGSKDKKFTAILTCEPSSKSIKRLGLRRRYQFTCPHVLFGTKCGLNRDDYAINVNIATVASGTSITLASGWSGATDYTKYVGGLLIFTDDMGLTNYRTILRTPDAVTLTLSGPTTGMTAGDAISVSRACNHQVDQCRDDFNNLPNYGGHPYIPLTNPISTNPFTA